MPQNVMTSYACIIPRGSVQQKIFTGCERHINLAAIYHLNSIKKQIWMHLKRRLMETNWCKTQCKIQIREFWNWYFDAKMKNLLNPIPDLCRWQDFCQREGNEGALRKLRELNHTSGGAPTASLIGISLSGAFSQGAIDFLTRMAKIKFPNPISSGSLSYLPARQRWTDWYMRIIQSNVLESVGAAVVSGIRIWKAKAQTALRMYYAAERTERGPRIWAARIRGCGPSESGIPPEI